MHASRAPRPRRQRQLRSVGLIVTEGEVTEKQYIERLLQLLKTRTQSALSVISIGHGGTPEQVLARAVTEREQRKAKGKSVDWCVCIFDIDQHPRIESVISDAKRQGIDVVVSNLKFENWLLWHNADVRKQWTTKDLDREMRNRNLLEKKHLAVRFPIENYGQAIDIAYLADAQLSLNRQGPNPSSAMPALIEKILRG